MTSDDDDTTLADFLFSLEASVIRDESY